MRLSLIAAVSDNGVIGKDNKMPWHLPADLKYFKTTTLGKPIIMGRKTWESLGQILPGRRHIVITRNKNYNAEGVAVVHSPEAALEQVSDVGEAIIIGGAHLYEAMLPQCDRLYLTEIKAEFEGDTFFPKWNKKNWKISFTESHQADERNPFAYQFVVYDRKPQRATSTPRGHQD
jgi:dihydrofolate reductase